MIRKMDVLLNSYPKRCILFTLIILAAVGYAQFHNILLGKALADLQSSADLFTLTSMPLIYETFAGRLILGALAVPFQFFSLLKVFVSALEWPQYLLIAGLLCFLLTKRKGFEKKAFLSISFISAVSAAEYGISAYLLIQALYAQTGLKAALLLAQCGWIIMALSGFMLAAVFILIIRWLSSDYLRQF